MEYETKIRLMNIEAKIDYLINKTKKTKKEEETKEKTKSEYTGVTE